MNKISYICDGIKTDFIFVFRFFQKEDVHVAMNNKILDSSQYAVILNENMDGGTIKFNNPPKENSVLDIFRQVHLSRTVDYQPTATIDPENLNADFDFLLEAFKDLKAIDLDLLEWKNVHDNILKQISYVKNTIEDKLSGGAVLGVYNNLVSVLENALPNLINDYGNISVPASNENKDDYGVL